MRNRFPRLALPLTLLFVSGVSALIYQVVWVRGFALIFGVTAYAVGLVLGTFMAGLAIGSAAGGSIADRVVRPLRAYGAAEIAVGCFALTVWPLMIVVQSVYVSLATGMADHRILLAVIRLGLSVVVLLPPTVAMGATLPLALCAFRSRKGASVGRLYAANTAGAVAGVLLAGFLLVGVLGLRASVYLAVILNLLVGVAAMVLSPHDPEQAITGPCDVGAAAAPSTSVRVFVLATTASCGFAALAFEVIWTRVFSLLAYELVYSYAAILAVVLAGVAFGSAMCAGRLRRRPATAQQLARYQIGIGAVALASPALLDVLAWHGSIGNVAGHWPLVEGIARRCPGCVTFLPGLLAIVFVTSLLSGASMPVAVELWTTMGARWTARFGALYAANVVGAVLGSFTAGFWLLPDIGASRSVLLVGGLSLAAGMALLTVARQARGWMAAAGATILMGYVGCPTAHPDVFRSALIARFGPTAHVRWSHEGVEASVAVIDLASGQHQLVINGAIHGSGEALGYHRTLGHLGPLVHPAPRRALIIGLGSGGTAGAMALYPGVQVHVVELSEGVIGAASLTTADNYGLLRRSNVTWQIDDGRNYLQLSGQTYDLIEADAIEPRHAGASIIYSQEFFESARRALAPGGLMIQWLGAPGTDAYGWTARTFASVFPHVTWWIGNGDVAIGSIEPQAPLDRARLARLLADPVIGSALVDAGLSSVDRVLALQAPQPRMIAPGPILTDDRPVLEYFLTLPWVSRGVGARR